MPTIALQVGQCGNQLGAAFWELLGQQQAHCRSSMLPQEWFATSLPHVESLPEPARGQNACTKAHSPRCICVDSESKVVKHWEGQQSPTAVHMLGRGGGCGNNWSCGYSLAFSSACTGNSKPCAWSVSDDQLRCIDQVLDGIRREAEREAGIPDFLLMSSLAGGTGSGFGSALLEVLADEYPCSTVTAVAVAPGRAGGSDTATQSINCCMALQHLSMHAHAVLLLDNQVLLDQLNARCSSSSRATRVPAVSTAARSTSNSSRKNPLGTTPGRACLQGVNELAAQALLGLLWPVGEADQLARRTNTRQLASTIAADPLLKFLEVCHVAQPDAELSVNLLNKPWPARTKLLASQLPAYDPFHPTQPVTTSAAFVVARGGLCTQSSKTVTASALAPGPSRAGYGHSTASSGGSSSSSRPQRGSCWVSSGGLGSVGTAAMTSGSSGGGWEAEAAVCAVSTSWPKWSGGSWDVQLADSTLPLWNAATGTSTSSLTAAVRRSSTGSFLKDVSVKCMQLCDAGAYMHWYQQYGTEAAEIRAAAGTLADLAAGY